MLDSMLSILIFLVIVTILIPGVFMLQQIDQKSNDSLLFHRQLYLEVSKYDDYEQFAEGTKKYSIKSGEICDRQDKTLCFKKK